MSRQDISAQQAEALNDTIKGLIEAGGGTVAKIEYWGLRNLTYRVKKNRKAHYSLLAVDAPPAAMAEVERQLSINEDVLRWLTVRVEELDLELSPLLARRERERERERERTRVTTPPPKRPSKEPEHDRHHRPLARARRPAPARPAVRSIVAARCARSRAEARRRSTTRTSNCCSATSPNAARSSLAHHRRFPDQATRTGQGHQARPLSGPPALRGEVR
jgi:small subunit ribosomal protein S6